MKKNIFLTTLILGAGLILASCGGSSSAPTKLPESSCEKVQFAFNGVEKSFKNKQAYRGLSFDPKGQMKFNNLDAGLATISNLFVAGDNRGDTIDELEYDQPPMIQFQYIKKVFDKVGSSYSFGTKYYDSIQNSVYIDFETGFKAEKKDEFKYDYNFIFGIEINIDTNDLITADVSFDITLSKGQVSYQSNWYVVMSIDYDMKNQTPNYKMTMVTSNDQQDIPFAKRNTYEYDYVEVKDNKIKEWRKFVLETNTKLVKDATHTSFDSYLDEHFEYVVGYPAWYKNNVFNKMTSMPQDKKITIGRVLFDNFGLNDTDINAGAFISKQGTQNSVIKTIYNEISQIYGDDILYDLVCHEDEHHDATPKAIRAMREDLSGGIEWFTIGNARISDLFNGVDNIDKSETVKVTLCYVDSDNGIIRTIKNCSSLNYYFTSASDPDAYQAIQGGLDSDFKTLHDGFEVVNETVLGVFSSVRLIFKDPALNVEGHVDFNIDLSNEEEERKMPTELLELGLPEYKTEKATYNFGIEGDRYILEITGSNIDEAESYVYALTSNMFVYEDEQPKEGASLYKFTAGDSILRVVFMYPSYSSTYTLTAWLAKAEASSYEEESSIEEFSEEFSEESSSVFIEVQTVSIAGSFNDWNPFDPSYAFNREEESFMSPLFKIEEGSQFKFVVNGDWNIEGGFGYHDVENIEKYPQFTFEGKEDNIKANTSVEVVFNFTYSTIAGFSFRIVFFNELKA